MNTNLIRYIGCDDVDLDLFESQYIIPNGISYNSYLLRATHIAVMDTVDPRKTDEWLSHLAAELGTVKPEYLIVQHMEPDHSGSIKAFVQAYPDATLVASKVAVRMMGQFGISTPHIREIKEGDTLDLGGLTLSFVSAPMVHWPEVMMTYVAEEKLLFSADAFGTFGVLKNHLMATPDSNWADEARRYYINICGKYGQPVSAVLHKATNLDIRTLAPLHGPVLEGESMHRAMQLYALWSTYQPETDGVLVAYASIHGNTRCAALQLADMLQAKGEKVVVIDLSREDMSRAVAEAFRMSKMLLCCATYDANIFPPMHQFLHKLQLKNYQSRRVGLLENGSWVPQAAKLMRAMLEPLADITIVEPVVSIRSALQTSDVPALEALVAAL